MAGGSHLKRLKTSLREQGIVGPQKSKKEKKRQGGAPRNRREAIQEIREEFNPFDLKKNARGPKFPVTSLRNAAEEVTGRPTASRSLGEERRRETLLAEMQRRNRVGGILDKRFGEADPTMAEEDKMLERFVREKQRSHKKTSLFDLEETEPIDSLTHNGQALALDEDFNEDDLGGSDSESERTGRKRPRFEDLDAEDEDGEQVDDQPQRKKTKAEVMQEVIAKSKAYKYERQVAKDEDDDLRRELDKDLPSLQMMLYGRGSTHAGKDNGDKTDTNITPLGINKDEFISDFDRRLKQLVHDRRSKPTNRTKTEEEKAQEESERLKELEEKRLKRMRGESVSDDSSDEDEKQREGKNGQEESAFQFFSTEEEEEDWGLGRGIKAKKSAAEFSDEDSFIIDDDLVASGSDLEPADSDFEDDDDEDLSDDEQAQDGDEESDDEFTKGLLTEEEARSSVFAKGGGSGSATNGATGSADELPYSFPCPQTYDELVALAGQYPIDTLPTIVQRIRALYHPKLDSKYKEMLGNFSKSLVSYIAADHSGQDTPFRVLESITRHIHSLSKSFPVETGLQFREHIKEINSRPLEFHLGDLTLFTAVGTIYPTSDAYHQVASPALLLMTRYLGQKIPRTLSDYALGTYLSTLAVQYQKLSRRFVPEAMNFCLNTLALAVSGPLPGNFPFHEPADGLRVAAAAKEDRKMKITDCVPQEHTKAEAEVIKAALIGTTIQLLEASADLWAGKASFLETFAPALRILESITSAKSPHRAKFSAALFGRLERVALKLSRMRQTAVLSRRPLLEHHHRPLAIKTSIPKFEDSFDPNKHYDPDRERAELAKLRAEHKKERKGALRELRKDARFMAREKLRAKIARDEAYEKKYKRLVAEIQNEEGREANAYEREKDGRKKARSR
ncbi:Nop14-like protein [Sodiomyces alkalinus F11]|uniref:Nop14-like protein n=1 Tax=Sodiomyces alkalinus (strain CBS 110278 / VKM F-3762 / F11) TaxID=1314773 RepID=A0A3N2PS15_SODAK|nr:Nop14-like protein [Sodiomyces alkalinus F11]ROT37309.1 Nop14-like protein [Sodiomyces alkalinus F11]